MVLMFNIVRVNFESRKNRYEIADKSTQKLHGIIHITSRNDAAKEQYFF